MNKPAKSQKATVGSKKAFWKVYELRTRYEVHKIFLKMQVKIFNIPISDDGQALEEMNKFLRSHKVIELQQTLINNDHGAVWCFCARYIQNSPPQNPTFEKQKADYKNLLDEKTFQIFSHLRDARKQIAKDEAIPAYAVFTDEELVGIAKLDVVELSSIKSVKGIGEKKTEKFGKKIIELFNQSSTK